MTKPMTAVGMMVLHDRGLCTPKAPIFRHLPEFGALIGPCGAALVHPPTMRELMTHTAGFGFGFDPPRFVDPYRGLTVWEAGSLKDFVRRVAAARLEYQPGSQWCYSMGMDLSGAIIQRLSGRMLPEFMCAVIFKPLGMKDTNC